MVNYDGVRCIMFEPDGGNVDPSGVTHAYAAGARARGAEIHRFTPVMGTEAQADGSWIVRTPKGDIHTQWVVNAAGLWGREVAAMAGISRIRRRHPSRRDRQGNTSASNSSRKLLNFAIA